MKELPDLDQYRPNVGICLMNRKGEVWLGKRVAPTAAQKAYQYRWQMPQGGVDRGEGIEDAAFRELYEETGVKSARILVITPGWLVYDFPSDYRAKKRDRWRGQKQKWVLMLFEGEDDEVDLDAHEPAEFCDWRWAVLAEMPELVVPFKRDVYKSLARGFGPMSGYISQQFRNK